MTKHVVFLNGYPKAGKDTFAENVIKIARGRSYQAVAISSIDPIRELLRHAGVSSINKTPEYRKLLATVGSALEEYNGFRTRHCAEWAAAFFSSHASGAFLIHMREPELIKRCRDLIHQLVPDAVVKTVFVDRFEAREAQQSNEADAGVEGMTYDLTIKNNGSLSELFSQSERFVSAIVQGLPLGCDL